jgi:hypothetical protein
LKEGNLIKWSLGQEKDNLLFEVYRRKADGTVWKKISTLSSKGDSNQATTYSYLDEQSSLFENYLYRVRQVSMNGTDSWSTVVRTFAKSSENEIVIFPNPHQGGPLKIHFPADTSRVISLKITNPPGQILDHLHPTEEISEELISSLSPGVYFIQIEFADKQIIKRFIKH